MNWDKLLENVKDPAMRAALERGLGKAQSSVLSPQSHSSPGTSIRIPKKREPNQGEAEYGRLLAREFPGAHIIYEAVTLRLPSGTRYTSDWAVFAPGSLQILLVETKGTYRLQSAAGSARAFKEACAAFPFIQFRHAAKNQDGTWTVQNTNHTQTTS